MRYSEAEMGVVKVKIQTVEDIYRLVWTAVASKRPISAIYKDRPRLFCAHRLGRNRAQQLRVLCYQYGGESGSGLAPMGSPENWRCVALEKLQTAEDQPARDPQKGHCLTLASKQRAMAMRSDVIERGLCRSGRTRRTARPELWRQLGRW